MMAYRPSVDLAVLLVLLCVVYGVECTITAECTWGCPRGGTASVGGSCSWFYPSSSSISCNDSYHLSDGWCTQCSGSNSLYAVSESSQNVSYCFSGNRQAPLAGCIDPNYPYTAIAFDQSWCYADAGVTPQCQGRCSYHPPTVQTCPSGGFLLADGVTCKLVYAATFLNHVSDCQAVGSGCQWCLETAVCMPATSTCYPSCAAASGDPAVCNRSTACHWCPNHGGRCRATVSNLAINPSDCAASPTSTASFTSSLTKSTSKPTEPQSASSSPQTSSLSQSPAVTRSSTVSARGRSQTDSVSWQGTYSNHKQTRTVSAYVISISSSDSKSSSPKTASIEMNSPSSTNSGTSVSHSNLACDIRDCVLLSPTNTTSTQPLSDGMDAVVVLSPSSGLRSSTLSRSSFLNLTTVVLTLGCGESFQPLVAHQVVVTPPIGTSFSPGVASEVTQPRSGQRITLTLHLISNNGTRQTLVDFSSFRQQSITVSVRLSCGAEMGGVAVQVPVASESLPLATTGSILTRTSFGVSLSSGSSATSVAITRILAAMKIMQCSSVSDGGGLLPLVIRRASRDSVLSDDAAEAAAAARGAIVGDIVVIAAVACVLMVAALCYSLKKHAPLRLGLLRVSLPSSLSVAGTIVLPSCLSGAVTLPLLFRQHGGADSVDVVITAAGLLQVGVVVAYFVWCPIAVHLWGLEAVPVLETKRNRPAPTARHPLGYSSLIGWWRVAVRRRFEWSQRGLRHQPAPVRSLRSTLLEFRCVWYPGFDVGVIAVVTVLASVSSALSEPNVCIGSMWAVFALYGAQLAVCLRTLPMTSRAGNVSHVVNVLLSCIVALLQSLSITRNFDRPLATGAYSLALVLFGASYAKQMVVDLPSTAVAIVRFAQELSRVTLSRPLVAFDSGLPMVGDDAAAVNADVPHSGPLSGTPLLLPTSEADWSPMSIVAVDADSTSTMRLIMELGADSPPFLPQLHPTTTRITTTNDSLDFVYPSSERSTPTLLSSFPLPDTQANE